MLELSQIKSMLIEQDAINAQIDPNWVETANPFLRAAAVEAFEALDHAGYKWWKKTTPDMPQLQLELVDIWHFVLSHEIIKAGASHDEAAATIASRVGGDTVEFCGQVYTVAELGLLDALEIFGGLCAARIFDGALFDRLLVLCDMSWAQLFTLYSSKGVLNRFRQDHGYKSGTYIKIWDGREDNEHLSEIIDGLDADAGDIGEQIYAALAARYPR